MNFRIHLRREEKCVAVKSLKKARVSCLRGAAKVKSFSAHVWQISEETNNRRDLEVELNEKRIS